MAAFFPDHLAHHTSSHLQAAEQAALTQQLATEQRELAAGQATLAAATAAVRKEGEVGVCQHQGSMTWPLQQHSTPLLTALARDMQPVM